MADRRAIKVLFIAVAAMAGVAAGAAQAAAPIDFARDVQPILSKHCYECHGPETSKSRLRLDSVAAILRGGESGEPVFVAGRSGQSHIIQLVTEKAAAQRMPRDAEPLTPAEVAVLRAWIDEGAALPGGDALEKPSTNHWSFQPLKRVEAPAVADRFITNEVDAFILTKLRELGLTPSPPADRRTLIRRLYLDVHGVPPTPEQARAFLEDERPDAWQRRVDEVLASPRYGERWAAHWLDVVRFAETHGFEKNQPRPDAWPYRDYVIRALNKDKPYDRFVFEQIAGSESEPAATGYLVAGPLDQVKSPDPVLTATQRQDELHDIVATTGTTFLGLTMGCARCHNHKFDTTITQTDYFAMQAVFAGVMHGGRPISTQASRRAEAELAEVQRRIAELQEITISFEPIASPSGMPVLDEGDSQRAAQPVFRDPVNPAVNVDRFMPVEARHVRFTVLKTTRGQPCIDELEVYTAACSGGQRRNVALASKGTTASASGTFANNRKHKLEHVNDGIVGNDRSWISNQVGAGWVQITFAQPRVIDAVRWGRDRTGNYTDRLAIEYVIEIAREPDQWTTVARSSDRLPYGSPRLKGSRRPAAAAPGDRDRLEEALQALSDLEARQKQLQEEIAQTTVYAGTFTQPNATHRLYRGDPTSPREVVAPDVPNVFASLNLSADAPEAARRTAFAAWIVSPDNPLTARVMVNRIWQSHFGSGIVETPSDLGANGSLPTHPELLDHLAARFVREGWSMKSMHRLILLSSTYRQSSAPRSEAMAVDAASRWLWRFPPRRLEAEAIHDSVLAVTGALDLTMGGLGFSVFKPNDNYVRVYEPREEWGPAEWRRQVYATKVRMRPDGVFGVFDCPDGGQVAPKRTISTTALQALNLFNSTFMVQQAELFAERLKRDAGGRPADQVRRAYALAYCRAPGEEELSDAVQFIEHEGLSAFCRAMLNSNELVFLP